MKKISLLFLLAVASIGSFAQYNGIKIENAVDAECTRTEATVSTQNIRTATNRAAMDTINHYYFDFSDTTATGEDTLPPGWVSVDRTGNGYEFLVTDTTYTGAYTNTETNPTGANIESATAENGFLHFPADYYNCVPGSWPPEMKTDADNKFSGIDLDAYIETDWMDFSSSPNGVIMQFSEWFRFCCSSATVKWNVSVTTNGSDWTHFDASDGVAMNESPATTDGKQMHIMKYNITEAIKADPTNVKIRFSFVGGSHYFISLDDLVFVEPYSNDVSISHTYAGSEGIYTTSFEWTTNLEDDYNSLNTRYYAVPFNLVNRLQLGALLHQVGSEATDAKIDFTITDDATAAEYWSGTSTTKITSFKPATGDSILFTDTSSNFASAPIFYAPTLQKGDFPKNYTFEYVTSSTNADANTTDNTASYKYQQTYGYYSYHIANKPNDQTSRADYQGWVGGAGESYAVGYDFLQEDGDTPFKIWGMRFYVGKKTTLNADEIGVIIQPKLFYWDNTDSKYVELEDVTASSITINKNMIDTFVYAGFNYGEVRDYDFEQGTYLVALEILKSNGCKFYLGVDNTYFQGETHFKAKNIDDESFIIYLGAVQGSVMIDAYTQDDALLEAAPHVRDGERELNKSSIEIYPNPTNGILYIKNAKESVISVYSLTGVLVKTVKNTSLNTQINLSNLAKGTYLVRVINNEGVTTRKINLTK